MRPHRWGGIVLALLLGMGCALGEGRGLVMAHALLARSDPPANAVLPTPPAAVTLWFTEPIAPQDSYAQLFDAQGRPVQTAPSHPGPTADSLVLPLPATLPPGTYTVQWVTVSTLDGHQTGGLVAFTVGSAPVVPAPPPPAPSGPPIWLAAVARGLRAIGLAGLLGILLSWALIRRAVEQAAAADRLAQRVWRAATVAWLLALSGTGLVVLAQALTGRHRFGPAAVWQALVATQAGQLLGLALLALAGAGVGLWLRRGWIVEGGAGLAALAQAAMSHAAAQPVGAPVAVLADLVHLVAASCWVGGLLVVSLTLGTLRALSDRPRVVAAVQRGSALFLGSVVALVLTGLYATWLDVGTPDGLTTAYGQTLAVKLGLVVLMLALAALHRWVALPRLAEGPHWFARTLVLEAVFGLGVLAVTGLLVSLPPARSVVEARAGRVAVTLVGEHGQVYLTIEPGVAGPNRYTADVAVPGAANPATQVLLRVAPRDLATSEQEVALTPLGGQRFSAVGSQLSLAGTWELELIVRRPGMTDWRAVGQVTIGTTPPPAPWTVPRPGWLVWLVGAGVVLGGVASIVGGLRWRAVVPAASQHHHLSVGSGSPRR